MLFIPLLPLGQRQKDHRLNEAKFEADSNKLHFNSFNTDNYDNFALYLINHQANHEYSAHTPATLTWVLVMHLLRNIVAHEKSRHWIDINDCLQNVLVYTKTRQNFRALIHAEEDAVF